ncbi:MAG: ferrous iron transport protein B [Lachnospiraceae bacterium]|jgi:ferrous iron transport protein B
MTLRELEIGKSAIIESVAGSGALRQHLLDMGLIPGTTVTMVKYAPMGDPVQISLNDYDLTLRKADAENIRVVPIDAPDTKKKPRHKKREEKQKFFGENKHRHRHKRHEIPLNVHPGFGEGGRFHKKRDENPLPEGQLLTIALAGNQNSGKTTLFNQLTGSNQHVGNFPGVTVERKSGAIRKYPNTEVTDLPGIYSMSPYSSEELVTRSFIIENKPSCIINIADATNIERNLYLTMQLMELDVPMVLALNMMDEMTGNGGFVRINEMEHILGIPVIPISASKNQGIDELINHAIHVAKYQEGPKRKDFCRDDVEREEAVHRGLHAIIHLIEHHARKVEIPVRFAATKLIEGDELVMEALNLSQNEKKTVEHIILQIEKESNLDRVAAIANMRFSFISRLVSQTVVKPQESREHERSKKIDRFLTGKYTGLLSFMIIIALIFYLTFNVIGAGLQSLLEIFIEWGTAQIDMLLSTWEVNAAVHSLVVDGILAGIGSVLSFLPIIVVLFFFLSMIEDTGYMARIAFVMDKLLRKIGLSGRSIVPLLIGFGCSVPAIMASRTLPSERDRKMTIMLTPFMSCSAKLPIYGFFAAAFFPKRAALVTFLLYFGGIVAGILVALVSKSSVFKGEAVPFVMELPNYRFPSLKNVLLLIWEKAKDFLRKAFTIIFLASIVIWFLQNFGTSLSMVSDPSESLLSLIAGFISPIFKPLGFGDWRICVALVTGFLAKESVVSTLKVLFTDTAALADVLSPAAAAGFLTFCLLYTPCVAAVAAVKRELGGKWAIFTVIFQCAVAWICAGLVRLAALLIGIA